MSEVFAAQLPDLDSRVRRSKGRLARRCGANVKLTPDELAELEAVAKLQGKALGEWGREELMAAARRPKDDILLTELIGLRMFLVNLLRPIALGEDYTDEQFRALLDHVRAEKRSVTSQVTEQYRHTQKEQ